jgi:hypothetical protein
LPAEAFVDLRSFAEEVAQAGFKVQVQILWISPLRSSSSRFKVSDTYRPLHAGFRLSGYGDKKVKVEVEL